MGRNQTLSWNQYCFFYRLIKSFSAIRIILTLEPVGRFLCKSLTLMTAFQLLIVSHWTVYPIHLIDSLIEVSYNPPLALLARTKRFSSRMHVCTLCQELNPSRGMSSRELSINIRALGEDVDA